MLKAQRESTNRPTLELGTKRPNNKDSWRPEEQENPNPQQACRGPCAWKSRISFTNRPSDNQIRDYERRQPKRHRKNDRVPSTVKERSEHSAILALPGHYDGK